MRPLELTMEGFTCFRDKTTIDLSNLEVFGISGATGAGKSSILDAITFALFGRVVRVGKMCTPLVSLGRDAMSVMLRFRVAGKEYRVARRLRRGAATTAILEDDAGALASKVRDVDARVEALLGMPFETFTQAVLLPQGQFARFLASTGAARTEILRNLLGLEIYDRMRRRAEERRKEAEQRLRLLDDQRAKHFGHASTERLAEIDALVAGDAERIAALSAEADEQRAALAQTTRDHERTRDLITTMAEVERLRAALDDASAARERIARAAAAEPLRASIAELDERTRALAARARSHARVTATLEATADVERVTKEALDRAAARAAEIPSLDKRIADLDRILDVAAALASDRAALLDARRALKDVERRDADARDRGAKLAGALEDARAAEASARARVDATDAERARADALDALLDDARAVVELERILGELDGRARDAAGKLERLEKEAAKDQTAADEAARSLDEAKATADAARAERERVLRLVEHEGHVDALREGLVKGAPCPVCEHAVDALPKRPKRRAKKAPQPDEAALDQRVDEWRGALAARRARVDATRAAILEARTERERAAEAVASARPTLDARRGALLAALPDAERAGRSEADVAPWLASIAAELRRSRAQHAAARGDLEKAAARAREAGALLEASRAGAAELAGDLAEKRARAAHLERVVADGSARVAAVTDAEDPAAERADAAARREALARALDAQRAAHAAAHAEHSAAKAVASESEREASALRASIERAASALESGSLDAGFSSADELRAALASPTELDALRRGIEASEAALRAAESRLADLAGALGELRIGDGDLARAKEAAGAAADRRDLAIRTHAAREQEAKQLRADLGRARALDTEREAAAAERAVFADLAADLGTANFQQHLQASVVRELTDQASQRLDRLSRGRYRLVVEADEFWVVDRENANASRPAATLSGGETFLASLSLALALSDQIQHAAGAVRLESLFIDEGFGTLDAEALDVAADAVEALEEGGRMVGIISHLPELNQRLRAELVVDKRASGSSVVRARAD